MPHGQHGVGLKSGTQEVRQDLKFKAILSYTVNLRPAYDAKTLPLKEKRKKKWLQPQRGTVSYLLGWLHFIFKSKRQTSAVKKSNEIGKPVIAGRNKKSKQALWKRAVVPPRVKCLPKEIFQRTENSSSSYTQQPKDGTNNRYQQMNRQMAAYTYDGHYCLDT